MEDLNLFALIQLVVTWILVGVIWFTQIVHYPLYRNIKEGFVEYERAHIRRTAFLIAPLMLIDVITAIILVGLTETGILTKLAFANLIFLVLIWLSTFLLQVEQHQKLCIRFSKEILRNLLVSNWVRTFLWTGKGLVLAAIVYLLFKHIT